MLLEICWSCPRSSSSSCLALSSAALASGQVVFLNCSAKGPSHTFGSDKVIPCASSWLICSDSPPFMIDWNWLIAILACSLDSTLEDKTTPKKNLLFTINQPKPHKNQKSVTQVTLMLPFF